MKINKVDQKKVVPKTDLSRAAVKHFKLYMQELNQALKDIDQNELVNFVNLINEAREQKRRVFIVGNGGSASTASHWATDMSKGLHHAGVNAVSAVSLTDNTAWISAAANDLGYQHIFTDQLRSQAQPGDLLITISASGNSKNIIHAIGYARTHEIKTLSIVGFDGGKAKIVSDYCLHIPTLHGRYGVAEDAQLILNHYICDFLVRQSSDNY